MGATRRTVGNATINANIQALSHIWIRLSTKPKLYAEITKDITHDINSAIVIAKTTLRNLAGIIKKKFQKRSYYKLPDTTLPPTIVASGLMFLI